MGPYVHYSDVSPREPRSEAHQGLPHSARRVQEHAGRAWNCVLGCSVAQCCKHPSDALSEDFKPFLKFFWYPKHFIVDAIVFLKIAAFVFIYDDDDDDDDDD